MVRRRAKRLRSSSTSTTSSTSSSRGSDSTIRYDSSPCHAPSSKPAKRPRAPARKVAAVPAAAAPATPATPTTIPTAGVNLQPVASPARQFLGSPPPPPRRVAMCGCAAGLGACCKREGIDGPPVEAHIDPLWWAHLRKSASVTAASRPIRPADSRPQQDGVRAPRTPSPPCRQPEVIAPAPRNPRTATIPQPPPSQPPSAADGDMRRIVRERREEYARRLRRGRARLHDACQSIGSSSSGGGGSGGGIPSYAFLWLLSRDGGERRSRMLAALLILRRQRQLPGELVELLMLTAFHEEVGQVITHETTHMHIDLSALCIRAIPNAFFPREWQRRAPNIDLSQNRLQTIPLAISLAFGGVQTLEFDRNPAPLVLDEAARRLRKLSVLSVRRCGITALPRSWALVEYTLVRLTLSGNPDLRLQPGDKFPRNLAFLCLTACGQTKIPSAVLDGSLHRLRELHLEYNPISQFTNEEARALPPNLRRLFIHMTDITMLPLATLIGRRRALHNINFFGCPLSGPYAFLSALCKSYTSRVRMESLERALTKHVRRMTAKGDASLLTEEGE